MNLESIYREISENINKIDFNLLWKGFKKSDFALYNDNECIFNGESITKPDEFLGNTAIMYKSEYIAIWKVSSDKIDLESLTASIIHEMFHAYQYNSKEERWANEIEALINYRYDHRNLSAKYEEAKLINQLISNSKIDALDDLLISMSYRKNTFPYEFSYESKVQQIEGSALYVELKALEILNKARAKERWIKILENILNPNMYFPIRIISYEFGAAILKCLEKNEVLDFQTFSSHTVFDEISKKRYDNLKIQKCQKIGELIDSYISDNKRIIEKALKKNKPIFEGNMEIYGLNIYNARAYNNFILSSPFIALNNNGEVEIYNGELIAEINDEFRVIKIYKH